jgi:hypothetical protein
MRDDLYSTEWRTRDRIKDALAEGQQAHFIRLARSAGVSQPPKEKPLQAAVKLRKLVIAVGNLAR